MEADPYVIKSFYGVAIKKIDFGYNFFGVLSYENILYYMTIPLITQYITNGTKITRENFTKIPNITDFSAKNKKLIIQNTHNKLLFVDD